MEHVTTSPRERELLTNSNNKKILFHPRVKMEEEFTMIFESKHDGEGGGGGVLATRNNLIAERC